MSYKESEVLAALKQASSDDSLAFHRPISNLNPNGSVGLASFSTGNAMPDSAVVRFGSSSRGMLRERCFHDHLNNDGFATPKVILRGEPNDSLAGRWLLIERVLEGQRSGFLGSKVEKITSLLGRADLLASVAAQLHTIDPGSLEQELESHQINRDWYSFLMDRAERLQGTGIDDALNWVRSNRVTTSVDVVTHGDLHSGNILMTTDGPVVIDWEIGAIAPASRDLAVIMFYLMDLGSKLPSRLQGSALDIGKILSRRFLAAYVKKSGKQLNKDELNWHRMLYSLSRLFWATRITEEGGRRDGFNESVAEDQDALAKAQSEFRLNVSIIREISGIDIRGPITETPTQGLI